MAGVSFASSLKFYGRLTLAFLVILIDPNTDTFEGPKQMLGIPKNKCVPT